MNPARFALQATGAGLGVFVGQVFVLPNIPQLPGPTAANTFGLDDVVAGACAVLGAMLGNAVYSRFLGK